MRRLVVVGRLKKTNNNKLTNRGLSLKLTLFFFLGLGEFYYQYLFVFCNSPINQLTKGLLCNKCFFSSAPVEGVVHYSMMFVLSIRSIVLELKHK